MSKIDQSKINNYVEKCPKPLFCEVDASEWRNALSGAMEAIYESDTEGLDTEEFWTLVYMSAVYFCKGMMWAETKAGLRPETNYPRY
jgi:hypothetical protein